MMYTDTSVGITARRRPTQHDGHKTPYYAGGLTGLFRQELMNAPIRDERPDGRQSLESQIAAAKALVSVYALRADVRRPAVPEVQRRRPLITAVEDDE